MGLVLLVVGGAFVGWLVAAVEEVDEGVLARMGVGVLGALLAGILLAIIGGSTLVTGVSWVGVLVGVIGAATLLAIVSITTNYSHNGSNTA